MLVYIHRVFHKGETDMTRLQRLHWILFHSEGALAELFLALISVTWGLWVASPFWSAFSASSSFRVMAEIAPEWVWGAVMTVVGLLKIHSIVSQNYRLKRIAFTVSLFVWSSIGISFILVSPYAVGTAIYSLILCANSFCLWRNGGKT